MPMNDFIVISILATCLIVLLVALRGSRTPKATKQITKDEDIDQQLDSSRSEKPQAVQTRPKPKTTAPPKHDKDNAETGTTPVNSQPPATAALAGHRRMASSDPDPSLLDATIMLVDDEQTTLDVLQALLEDAGYRHFLSTSRSDQAMAIIGKENPDVVLTDLHMQKVSGFDILQAMRAHIRLQHIPVIVLTSADDAETKLQALQLGATDFLSKPVDPSELSLRLRNTLAAKAHQDRLANNDALTGLPNRRAFMSRLNQALQQAVRSMNTGAVLHISLDRFKQINETWGHSAGDLLLKTVAQRLEHTLQKRLSQGGQGAPKPLLSRIESGQGAPKPLLSRIGGDEFMILLPETAGPMHAEQLARHVLEALGEPFQLDNHDLFVTACIGIAIFPTDGADSEALLKNVDIATNHTKQKEGNSYAFYAHDMNAKALERLSLENPLRKAIEHNELQLYYQPQIEVKTERIMGAEVLLHWKHPELGMLPPEQFMPLAEDIGLTAELGEWALHTACEQAKTWQESGYVLSIAMNVSSQQLHDRNFKRTLYRVLAKNRLAPQHLTLAFTESMLMQNTSGHVEELNQLKDMGIRIAIDHFGQGYSSLIYLDQFPLDELKIDPAFLQSIRSGTDDAPIITAIIAMAHSLGLTTVAEGVEIEKQFTFLRDRGCDAYQGSHCSPPVPETEFTTLLTRS